MSDDDMPDYEFQSASVHAYRPKSFSRVKVWMLASPDTTTALYLPRDSGGQIPEGIPTEHGFYESLDEPSLTDVDFLRFEREMQPDFERKGFHIGLNRVNPPRIRRKP